MASHVHSHPSPLDGAQQTSSNRWVRFIDTLGIWLSALCVVHCALTPVLIVALPVIASHEFDLLARSVLAGIGVLGVGLGTWMHRNLRAIPLLLAALVLFAGLGLFELVTGQHPDGRWELGLGIVASFALMGAHTLNTRACRDSDQSA